MDRDLIDFAAVLEEIYIRYGYDLRQYATQSIRRRLEAALARNGLTTLGELRAKLSDPAFASVVLQDLTVQVTDMFRDPEAYAVFRERIVPLLMTYPVLRAWVAGCASGEEAYSTAILLREAGLETRAQIYATDISVQAVEAAKQGVYRSERLATFLANYRAAGGHETFSDYYTSAYGHIAMNESLRKNILFFQHDLVTDQVFGEMQFISCRNVLIYFSRELKLQVLQKFAASLCPGGLLLLGGSERLNETERGDLFTEYDAGARIYQRKT